MQSKERQREAHRRMPSRFPFTGRWQGPPWSPLAGRRPTRRRPRGGEFRRGRGYPGCGACTCSPRSGSERCTGVCRTGFLLHGKLARPALVATSRATAHAPSAQAGKKDNWRSACALALTGKPVTASPFQANTPRTRTDPGEIPLAVGLHLQTNPCGPLPSLPPEGWVWSSSPTLKAKQPKRQNHAAQKRPRSWQNPIVDILGLPQ